MQSVCQQFPYISLRPRFCFIPHTGISKYFLEVCPLDVTQVSQSGIPDPLLHVLSSPIVLCLN